MKKLVILLISLITCICLSGCANDHPPGSTPYNRPPTYMWCEIANADNEVLYEDTTPDEDIPILVVGEEYQIILGLAPGPVCPSYEFVELEYNEQDVSIPAFDVKRDRYFKLRGLRDCTNTVVSFKSDGGDRVFECSIKLSFSSEVS